MSKQSYYLTTAIPYASAEPHIGHAIEFLYTDVMARYQRLLSNDVYFLSGTDEHGQKVMKMASEVGMPVEKFADQQSASYENLLDQWNISNNDFIRTTEKRHMAGAQKFWQAAMENGHIYKKKYSGTYCIGCEAYKTEKDLVNGVCPDHPNAPSTLILLEEENYFFKLSAFQEPLQFLFDKQPDFVYPESRRNEMYNFLKSGIDDISISRSKEKLPWGIPVPGDDSQVMYVWFDALTNYITALGYGTKDESLLKKYWPGIHVIGKEINRFHSLLWPAMLMAAGLDVPKQIAVHGWITVDGQKMSKTVGNVINPLHLTEQFPLDSVRYFLMREIPFDNDGDFSFAKFTDRFNADLANGLGNFANRVLTMIEKYSDNTIPAVTNPDGAFVGLLTKEIWPEYLLQMNRWRFDRALDATWKFITFCDQQISDQQPWAMAKAGKMEEVHNLLYHLSESLRHIAVMIWPVMPETAEKIFTALGLDVGHELGKSLDDLRTWVELTVGNKITKGEALFPRLEKNV